MNYTDKPASGKKDMEFWNFVNVCAVFLAFISLYTTAEGMNRFFFRDDKIHGYLISLAVQGILLALNLRLPRYLKGKARPAKCCAVGLYLFTVLWSSGFSYIFMSNVIYEDTWMKDAQIELGGLYQKGKQELSVQAKAAMETVMGRVLSDVTAFKARAAVSDSLAAAAGTAADYAAYGSLFSDDAQLLQIIYGLKEGKGASGEMQVISERERAFTEKTEAIRTEIEETDEKISGLDSQRTELIGRRANVPADSDAHRSYSASIDEKTAAMEELRRKKENYENDLELAEKKLDALRSLDSVGHMAQNSASGQTDQYFAQILGELGGTKPDIEKISGLADSIYTVLVNGSAFEEDTAEYGQLLNDYLQLRADLGDAAGNSSVLAWLEKEDTTAADMEKLVKAGGTQEELAAWREGWNRALSELKNQLLRLPLTEEKGNVQDGKQTEDPEKRREALSGFITRLQRNYLLELNDVEKAGNYLTGSYPAMAWFSLLFAVYLDTAPMLLSVFKYCSGRKTEEPEKKRKPYMKAALGVGCAAFLILNSLLFLKIF